MTELLTAAQMRAIEAAAIASGQVTGLELMERAGRGVFEAIFEEWPELRATSHRAVVLCGPGNNGGDGFVVARLLQEWGWEVEVFLYGDPERLPPDARVNYERWAEMGEVGVANFNSISERRPYDLRIDAAFGTGLKGFPSAALIGAFEAARAARQVDGSYVQAKRVAVDCPSCLDLDSGRPIISPRSFEGDYHLDFFADLTVSFHRPKVGHVLNASREWSYCGHLKVVDIGLEPDRPEAELFSHAGIDDLNYDLVVQTSRCIHLESSGPTHSKVAWPASQLWKSNSDHKYSHGHALILSGPSGHGGAARLAARGSLRIGAGVVTVGCPPDAIPENAARLDAVMLRGVADGDALAEVLEDRRINALCLGPGMGLGAREAALVGVALLNRGERRSVVLDADALTLLAGDAALFGLLHKDCVLTPHAGDFARLFPDIAAKLNAPATKGPAYSKVDATREAAQRAGCVVLFKGPDTVVAAPNGRCSINSAHYDRAAPWLATAGSGDVLAGFITGLLARGFDPMRAAEAAAWLHVECARSFGPGLIAEDIPEELPKVFRALGL